MKSKLNLKASIPTLGETVTITASGISIQTGTNDLPGSQSRTSLLNLQQEMNELVRTLSPAMEQYHAKEIDQLAKLILKLRSQSETATSID
jgi:hypothetical protein